ncbi:MAG: nuclear transport factor 2 family protein [Candidatus Competibacteraceae bacterium]|nr:nuclear transport factor 2 family protein [Candidatus Competibacteraceae bacterium]
MASTTRPVNCSECVKSRVKPLKEEQSVWVIAYENCFFAGKKGLLGITFLLQGSFALASAPNAQPDQPPAINLPASESVALQEQKVLEKALEERVSARWTALIKRDFAAVYEFQTPAYRGVYNMEAFNQQFGSAAKWTQATVEKITMQTSSEESNLLTADVVVNIHYTVPFPSAENPTQTSGFVNERWLRKGGQWWYLDFTGA